MDDTTLLNDPLPKRQTSWWKLAYHDLKTDLRDRKWLWGIGRVGCVLWLIGLVASACTISIMPLSSTISACQPDGSFRLRPETYSVWSSSGFFQITLGGGHLTFSQAKVIDIVWDVVIGRGGQFLLAYLSMKVFRRYLTICMGTRPITFQTFRTIFIQTDPSLPDTYGILKGFWQRRLESKIAMAFMITTMVFILIFPTLASAMSGYDANVSSYMPDYEENFIPFNNFSRIIYIVHDAQRLRLNHTADLWARTEALNYKNKPEKGFDPVLPAKSTYYIGQKRCAPSCAFLVSLSRYIDLYGMDPKNVSSVFKLISVTFTGKYDYEFYDYDNVSSIDLLPPTLNISSYASPEDWNSGWEHPGSTQMWGRANQTYNTSYIQENGNCQTTGDYQWGFSFLQLFICVIFLVMWSVGISIMWLYAHFRLGLRNISGPHKGTLELAASMQHELDIKHVDMSLLIERQLDDRIDTELKGGSISYMYAPAYTELATQSLREGIRACLKREKWWFIAIFVSSVLSSTQWMSPGLHHWKEYVFLHMFWLWSFGPWVGLTFAMCIGTTNKSKALFTLICGTLAFIVIVGYAVYVFAVDHTEEQMDDLINSWNKVSMDYIHDR